MLSFGFTDDVTFCSRGEQSGAEVRNKEETEEEEEERGQSDQNRRREQVNFTEYRTMICQNAGK